MDFRLWVENTSTSYIFLDLDGTLVHTVPITQLPELQQSIKITRIRAQENPKFSVFVNSLEKRFELYKKSEVFHDGSEERIIIPRPGLREFLQAIQVLGSINILTSSHPLYAASAIDALHLKNMFDGIYSTKGKQPPPVIKMRVPWVLVDDVNPGHKINNLGAEIDFGYGDSKQIENKLMPLVSTHCIRITAFTDNIEDKELSHLSGQIASKLKLQGLPEARCEHCGAPKVNPLGMCGKCHKFPSTKPLGTKLVCSKCGTPDDNLQGSGELKCKKCGNKNFEVK